MADKECSLESVRHIKLGFELFRGGEQYFPSAEQTTIILDLFPTSYRMTLRPPFLIIYCTKLPPKPWPVSVAGLPLFLTDKEDVLPMDWGLPGRGPKATINSSISRWTTPDLKAFEEIFELLDGLGARIDRLQWIGTGFLALAAKEPFEDWSSRLPWLINGIVISYIFGEVDVRGESSSSNLTTGE